MERNEMKICSLRNENLKATPTTRDRGRGDWNQRHYDRFTLSKTQIS